MIFVSLLQIFGRTIQSSGWECVWLCIAIKKHLMDDVGQGDCRLPTCPFGSGRRIGGDIDVADTAALGKARLFGIEMGLDALKPVPGDGLLAGVDKGGR